MPVSQPVAPDQIPSGAAPRLFRATGARINPQVEWVEVQVKSVINRVQGMPFKWSINPYRGCEHACVFCTSPETQILMGDGTYKAIADVHVGDEIYGTVREGFYRRYVKTRVLAHWETCKPAYRVTLEDGTQLVASGDHRFLTERGWKFVQGAEHGLGQRPFLTPNNKLMGVGAFAKPPHKNSDYRRGYLCGIIRGDGHLASHEYSRVGRRHGNVHQFRLALTDIEALRRAASYLQDFDIPTFSFVFAEASGRARAMHGIRTSSRKLVDGVGYLVEWPQSPSTDWFKGFLAGIFDAEGHHNESILRIANTNPVILENVGRGLSRLGFDHVTEAPHENRPSPVSNVRVRGGLREQLRFFHTMDSAIARKRDFEGQAVKGPARLRVLSVEPLGREMALFDITTGTGDFIANGVISHNCYARLTHWYLDQDGVNNWSSRIFVKVNAPEVLRHELARPSWQREEVNLGTATDPYQPAEGAYKITRQILEALRDYRTPVAIITRSTMVVRDADVLQQLARGPGAMVCFSLSTVDETLARELEPNAPPPLKRLEAMQTLHRAGVPTGLILAPVLPGITDHPRQLGAVIETARKYGASTLWTIPLHLGDVTRQTFFEYLEHKRPQLVPEYERLYRGKYAPASYRRRIQTVVSALKRRYGLREPPPERRSPQPGPPPPEQLALL